MPSIARVRGRAGNRRAIQEQMMRWKARQFKKSTGQAQNKASNLGSLPTEIIQDIFCYGTNLQLPLVSSRLYSQLTSESVRTRLLHRVFRDRRKERSCDTPQRIAADIQSALLRQKWLSYEFLRKCQWQFIERTFRRELFHFCKSAPGDVTQTKYTDGIKRLSEGFRQWDQCADGFGVSATTEWGDARQTFVLPNRSVVMHESLRLDIDNGYAVDHDLKSYTFPYILPNCELPTRLLHGPWTKGRGLLLATVLKAMDQIEGEREVIAPATAARGIDDAIRERCLSALTLFMENNVGSGLRKGRNSHVGCTHGQETQTPWIDRELDLPWKGDRESNYWLTSDHIKWPRSKITLDQLESYFREGECDDRFFLELLRGYETRGDQGPEVMTLLMRLRAEYQDDQARTTQITGFRSLAYQLGNVS